MMFTFFRQNKRVILNELEAFVAGLGTWILASFALLFILSLVFPGLTSNKVGILITLIGFAGGVFVAYLVNGRKLPKLTLSILLTFAAVFSVLVYLVGRSIVYGIAMEPSYKNGEGVWVDRFTVEFNKPKRGEVVLAKDSSGEGESIRRVIGLPGEEIKLLGSMVIINGTDVLVEPYAKTAERCAMGISFANPSLATYKLSTYEYLVLPDHNRTDLLPPTVVSELGIVGRIIGQKGELTVTKLSPSGLKEYTNPDLGVSFQYSLGCVVEGGEGNKIVVKESKSGSVLLGISLFAQNPRSLSTEEWIKDNYTIVDSIYCAPEENCRVIPGDKLFQITDKFKVASLEYIAGSLKDSSYKDPNYEGSDPNHPTYVQFVATHDKVYQVSSGDKSLLEAIKFEK